MKSQLTLVAAATLTAACTADETLTAYGAADHTWHLVEVNDAPAPARLVLTFPQPGAMAGKAPCNSFSGKVTAPYPWFATGPLAVTRRACPELAAEARLLDLLAQMTLSEVSGRVLILSADAGQTMVFTARPDE